MTVEQLFNHFEYYPEIIKYEELTYGDSDLISDTNHRNAFFNKYREYKVVDWMYDSSRSTDVITIIIKRY